MIRGWFMEVPSWRGRDGTRIPESGLAAHTSRSESASESASSEVLDGAGTTGDSIGAAVTQLLAAAGTTRGATLFITGAPTTEAGARAGELTIVVEPRAAQFPTVAASTEVGPRAEEFPTVPAQRPELSTETGRRREATLHPAVRAASARAPSAASRRADRQRAIRHEEGPVLVAEQRVAEVVEQRAGAGVGNRSFVMFLVACKIWTWREAICRERS